MLRWKRCQWISNGVCAQWNAAIPFQLSILMHVHTIKANEIITCQAIVNEIYATFMSWTELTESLRMHEHEHIEVDWNCRTGIIIVHGIPAWAVSECGIILRLIVRIISSATGKIIHKQMTILHEWRKRCIGESFWFNEWHHFSLEWFHFCHGFLFSFITVSFFFLLPMAKPVEPNVN